MAIFTRITYTHHKDIDTISFSAGGAGGSPNWEGQFYLPYVPKGNEVRYITEIEEKNGIEIKKSSVVQEVRVIRFMASEAQIRSYQKLPLLSDVRFKVGELDEERARNVKFSVDNWLGTGAFAMCKIEYIVQNYVSKATTRDIV